MVLPTWAVSSTFLGLKLNRADKKRLPISVDNNIQTDRLNSAFYILKCFDNFNPWP
jgi:hypothetical protein